MQTSLFRNTLIAALFLVSIACAHAATIIVDSADDGSSATACTLRDAVASANNDSIVGGCTAGSGTDTIEFDPAVFSVPTTIYVTNGDAIEITADLNIIGATDANGALLITLDANNNNRIFHATGGNELAVENLIFQNADATRYTSVSTQGGAIRTTPNGYALSVTRCIFDRNVAASGGAIYLGAGGSSTVRVSDSTFTHNQTTTGLGGAIASANDVIVATSTFANNTAALDGGAILAGNATVAASTFSDNSADRNGGAIYAGNVTVAASTFVGNHAAGTGNIDGGGAIFADDNLDARHLTMVNNTATSDGASVYVLGDSGDTMAIHNSIIVGNDWGNATEHCVHVHGAQITGSYNLEWVGDGTGDQGSCSHTTLPQSVSAGTATQVSDIVSTTLADNGGPTQTLALVAGSAAIGAADATTPNGTSQMLNMFMNPIAWTDATVDQRGSARKAVTAPRDLGAFETNALTFGGIVPGSIVVNDAYSGNVSAGGGTGPYAYEITRGSLPPGVTLNADGTITGTPTQTGSYTFAITATDNGSGTPALLTGGGFTIHVLARAGASGVSVPVLPLPLVVVLAGLVGIIGVRRFGIQ